jgi:hypothetical protein
LIKHATNWKSGNHQEHKGHQEKREQRVDSAPHSSGAPGVLVDQALLSQRFSEGGRLHERRASRSATVLIEPTEASKEAQGMRSASRGNLDSLGVLGDLGGSSSPFTHATARTVPRVG